MPVTAIGSADDPRLDAFSSLRDGVLRDHGGRADPSGTPVGAPSFIAESEEMVLRAIATGHHIVRVLADDAAARRLSAALDPTVEILSAPREVIARVSGLGVHRGALALVRRPPAMSVAQLVTGRGDLVILEAVTNPVNVGLIARSALALGMGGLLLDATSADPLYRRAISSSRGATLSLAWARATRAGDLVREVEAAGVGTIALTLADGARRLETVLDDPRARLAVVLGSEGSGLAAETQAACTHRAIIDIDGGPGVDSLNVAAAAAIAFHELRRRRRDGQLELS